MTYQSIYLRHRPKFFKEVIGQSSLTLVLKKSIVEKCLGTAYLFSGPRGTGKTTTARILARVLGCAALVEDGEPCGVCDNCLSISASRPSNLIEIDAASNNTVGDIHDLTINASLATSDNTRVYVLDEVHMLSGAAETALAMILENTPPYTTFLLATTEPNKVSSMVKSKTQHFELSLVNNQELEKHVRRIAELENIQLSENALQEIVQQGDGSVRDALSALESVAVSGDVVSGASKTNEFIKALVNKSLTHALKAIQDAERSGISARNLAKNATQRLREMFLASHNVELSDLSESKFLEDYSLIEKMGLQDNVKVLEAIGGVLTLMSNANNEKILLESAIVKLLSEDYWPVNTKQQFSITAIPAVYSEVANSAVVDAKNTDEIHLTATTVPVPHATNTQAAADVISEKEVFNYDTAQAIHLMLNEFSDAVLIERHDILA